MTEKLLDFADLAKQAADAGVMKKLVISKPSDKSIKKFILLPMSHKQKTLFVFETYLADGKKLQKNYDSFPKRELCDALVSCMQANIILPTGECELKSSKKGACTILGKAKLESAINGESKAQIQTLNREKNYILSGDEDFLRELDVTDQNGKIKDKRQAKFRQINKFLEQIEAIYGDVPREGTLCGCDLCCG